MIITGGAQSSWKTLADTLMDTGNNQRVRVVEIRGFAADSVHEALRQLSAIAMGIRAKRFYYHASISPRAQESLTEEQWEKAADTLEKALGLDRQPRLVVEHEKSGRTYRHVVWSRIDVDTMTVINQDWNYRTHHRTADALEKEFGHEPTPRLLNAGVPNGDLVPLAVSGKRRSGSGRRKRPLPLSLRVSPEERAAIEAAAERAGLTIGSYIRSCALAAPTTRARRRPPADTVALARLLGEVTRAGTNLDQLARTHARNVPLSEEISAALAANRQAVEVIMAAMGRA